MIIFLCEEIAMPTPPRLTRLSASLAPASPKVSLPSSNQGTPKQLRFSVPSRGDSPTPDRDFSRESTPESLTQDKNFRERTPDSPTAETDFREGIQDTEFRGSRGTEKDIRNNSHKSWNGEDAMDDSPEKGDITGTVDKELSNEDLTPSPRPPIRECYGTSNNVEASPRLKNTQGDTRYCV